MFGCLKTPPPPSPKGVRINRGTNDKDTRYRDFTSKRRKLPLHYENVRIYIRIFSIVIDYENNLMCMRMIML